MSFHTCFDWFKKLSTFSVCTESENRRRSQGTFGVI